MNTNTMILNTLKKEIEASGIYTGYQGSFFEKTFSLLLENIREEEATKKGNKKPVKIIEKMVKKADNRPMFKKAHKWDGGYGFTDGYRIFFSDNSEGFEEAVEPHESFNLNQFVESTKNYIFSTLDINIEELRYYIKVAKPTKRGEIYKPFLIAIDNNQYMGFNPLFLLDLIEYSGTNTIKYTANNAPIMSENEKALLLPVNVRHVDTEMFNSWRLTWFEEKAA